MFTKRPLEVTVYRQFQAKNFRLFNNLHLTDIGRVNLVAGSNNVGKTALLEALFLHAGAFNPALALTLAGLRGIEKISFELSVAGDPPWLSLFRSFNTGRPIELEGLDEVSGRRVVRLRSSTHSSVTRSREGMRLEVLPRTRDTYGTTSTLKGLTGTSPDDSFSSTQVPLSLDLEYEANNALGSIRMLVGADGIKMDPPVPPALFPTFFLPARGRPSPSEIAERYGSLAIRKREDIVLRALQIIEPRLTRLVVAVTDGTPTLHGDTGESRLMPLHIMGDGMSHLARIVAHIGNAQDGVVLIDEVETGLHHSVLRKVWTAIGDATREYNAQIFATTHSYECIAAAGEAFSQTRADEFRLHRLERRGETIQIKTFDQSSLSTALELDLEVR